MTLATKIFASLIIAAFALLSAACPERTTIADIERNPGKYNNKNVAIAGVVRDSYGISVPGTPIRGGAYKVDDGTGTIWIITEDSVPNNGAEIGVQGTIGTGVSWKGKNYGLGMYEKDRRFRKR
jgi:hypothetical protein